MTARPGKTAIVVGVVVNGILHSGVPLLAMFLLSPVDFGAFSVIQLVFGFGSALVLSVVCEPWARGHREISSPHPSDATYLAVLYLVALATAAVVAIAAALTPGLADLVPWAVAGTVAAVVRLGTRYKLMFEGHARRALLGDSLGLAGIVVGLVVAVLLRLDLELQQMVIIWSLAMLASAAPELRLPGAPLAAVREWRRRYAKTVQILVGDALITDVGGTGVQFLMVPVLGLRDFGVYRALSSSAAPVRLVVAPLRPVLARLGGERLTQGRTVLLGLVGTVVLSGLVWAALSMVGSANLELGTFAVMAQFAPAVALYFGGNFILQIYSALGRIVASGSHVLGARVCQTLLAGGVPLVAALILGLEWAMYSFAITTWAAAMVWFVVCRRQSGGGRCLD